MDANTFKQELKRRGFDVVVEPIFNAAGSGRIFNVLVPKAFSGHVVSTDELLTATAYSGVLAYVYAIIPNPPRDERQAPRWPVVCVYMDGGIVSGRLVYDGDSLANSLATLDVERAARARHRVLPGVCRQCGTALVGDASCSNGCEKI